MHHYLNDVFFQNTKSTFLNLKTYLRKFHGGVLSDKRRYQVVRKGSLVIAMRVEKQERKVCELR